MSTRLIGKDIVMVSVEILILLSKPENKLYHYHFSRIFFYFFTWCRFFGVQYICVKFTTGPVPPNRPIPINGPILTTGLIVSSFPTNEPIFPTTRPTFKRDFHKWAERNV